MALIADKSEDPIYDAKQALARQILQSVEGRNDDWAVKHPNIALQLAEALAWLSDPKQPHGG